jgi:hypothetical protein
VDVDSQSEFLSERDNDRDHGWLNHFGWDWLYSTASSIGVESPVLNTSAVGDSPHTFKTVFSTQVAADECTICFESFDKKGQ